jgi:uncharacterized OB-fold protein
VSRATAPLVPKPTPDSAGFWSATAEGTLALSWCPACARYRHPPLERCATCAGPTEFRAVSGTGTLFSYIVVHRAIAPGYTDKPGHVIGLVELDDQPGLRLTTQLPDLTAETARIGMRLRADIVELPGSDQRVPVFRPA